jgi:hypothetical protein
MTWSMVDLPAMTFHCPTIEGKGFTDKWHKSSIETQQERESTWNFPFASSTVFVRCFRKATKNAWATWKI